MEKLGAPLAFHPMADSGECVSWENRERIQELLLLGQCPDIEKMHPRERPLSKALEISREDQPPSCIATEVVYRLPAHNSDVFLVGDTKRRVVKIKDGEIIEERDYIEGFTLQGLLLAPKDVRLVFDAIIAFHKRDAAGAPSLQERMPWASKQTLSAIAALPGPVVCCHLDATTANILVDPSGDTSRLIDDEYRALAPAVFDFGIFVAKLKRKESIVLPEALLPDMPGLQEAAELAHQLWLESR